MSGAPGPSRAGALVARRAVRAAVVPVVTVVVAVAGVAACTSGGDVADVADVAGSPAPSTAPLPAVVRTVAVVGDSITVAAADALRAEVGALGLDVAIDAENGRRLTAGGPVPRPGDAAVAERRRVDPPDLWVVALGTNDVGLYDGVGEYRGAITDVLDELPADAPLVWVGVWVAAATDRSAEFNRTLRALLDERGRAVVVDWAAEAAGQGVLADGVHPSAEGVERFADVVAAGVATWLG